MIPIYRAKKIDSDEYVIGYYMPNYVIGDYESEDEDEREEWTEHFIMESFSQDLWVDDESYYNFEKVSEIDQITLAIHFPNMIDSQGNKIFASLQVDGKGGDVLDFGEHKEVLKYEDGIISCYMFTFKDIKEMFDFEVVGIQQ